MLLSFYDESALGYNELHGEEQRKKLKIIKENFSVKGKVLDIGCGTGISSDFDDVVGIDPSFELLKQSNKRKVQAIGEYLPFKDDSFDFVISLTAIHNFDDIKKGVEEMKRVGKKIVVSVLKKSSKLKEIDTLLRQSFKIEKVIEEEKDMIYYGSA